MSNSLESVEAAALRLAPEERERLAQRLLDSLPGDPEVEAVWDAEVRRRISDLETGAMTTIPAHDVLAEARRMLNA